MLNFSVWNFILRGFIKPIENFTYRHRHKSRILNIFEYFWISLILAAILYLNQSIALWCMLWIILSIATLWVMRFNSAISMFEHNPIIKSYKVLLKKSVQFFREMPLKMSFWLQKSIRIFPKFLPYSTQLIIFFLIELVLETPLALTEDSTQRWMLPLS